MRRLRRRILIVDDVVTNRLILRKILSADYEVLEAGDGGEALELMRQYGDELSAVILDIVMPGMDGYEVLSRRLEEPEIEPIPVIVATGNTETGAENRALALGANDFVTKPYKPETIKHRLNNVIKLRETAATINALRRDKLTGLYSREYFFQRAAELIAAKEPGYYVLSSLDIDSFKVINDRYGSEKGDEILRGIAEILERDCEADGCICARISADNFAVLYPKELLDSGVVGQHRYEASLVGGVNLPMTLSTGRYLVEDKSLSVSVMFDRAMMAQASVKGRFDVHVAMYDESMRRRLLREQEIISRMDLALAEGEFEVWFQPQYNHSTGALIGAEALARWRDPERGMVTPNEFIPVFERSGFVYELDKFIWERVCMRLRAWIDAGRSPLPVSVNISRYDLLRDDLTRTIADYTEKYGVPAELLRLEITESAFAGAAERVIGVVKELIDLGFTIEIDDFGSGYSSLNTLKDVPAQIVKLDMRFLEDMDGSGRGGNILESVVRMVKWLGMSVIAEGVETIEQADFLKSIGCSYVQGYLYARPMPPEEYEALAREVDKEEKLLVLETAENLDNNAFWDPKSMDTLIFNSYVGGACIFEYHRGRIELLRATERYVRILGSSDVSVEQALKMDWAAHLDPESREALAEGLRRSIETKDEVSGEFVFQDLPWTPDPMHLRSAMRVVARAGERLLVYCTSENITGQREAERKEKQIAAQLKSLNENLTALMNDTPGGFARLRVLPDGGVATEYVNEAFCRLRGMSFEEIIEQDGEDAMDTVHPDDLRLVRAAIAQMLSTNRSTSFTYRLKHADGSYIPITAFCRVTRNEDGVMYLNVYFADLGERERGDFTAGDDGTRLQVERRRRRDYERLLFDAAAEVYADIVKIDLSSGDTYRIIFENGVPMESDLGQKWMEYYMSMAEKIHPDDRETAMLESLGGELDGVRPGDRLRFTYRRREGDEPYRWYSTTIRSVPDGADGGAPTATAFTVDIDDEMSERARLKDLSEHDGLTDLFNRVKFEAMREGEYKRLRSCGILFFDVNYLKLTNDTHGHEMGNALLCQVADSIRSITNRRIHGYRYGGDEFIVVACDVRESELEHILAMWSGRLNALAADSGLPSSVAVGKAWSKAPVSISELIVRADEDMYRNKDAMKS